MTIDEIWDGAYKGLYGEVVTEDIYRIRQLKFVPDLIFDLGANVGTFSRFARELFPNAVIVAVEPDMDNVKYFRQFNNPQELTINLENVAIGNGECYRCENALNGAHEVYVTEQLGFEGITENEVIKKVATKTILLDKLANSWLMSYDKYMVKIDIEGAETILFTHQPSVDVLLKAEYVAIELHYHALENVEPVKKLTLDFMESMKKTHDTVYEHPMFYATKR